MHRQLLDGTTTVSPPDRGVYRQVETFGTTVEVLNVEEIRPVSEAPERGRSQRQKARVRHG